MGSHKEMERRASEDLRKKMRRNKWHKLLKKVWSLRPKKGRCRSGSRWYGTAPPRKNR